ncbi:hypothetical protein OE88DRAFT_630514 [Heliocybe sulcata]|uniref:F-box domain-containing protein n=1 Tax=Heliocybe sulcata TaxID=5364 RepID=A0A5C3NDY8_9AGAM|nr:hypothetical protein OE88DRAFT_630514 [Heliocybe sulcata]
MHRCLLIPELLSNIFEFQERKRELAILARTCRAFGDPALDVLWRDLSSLSTLIKATVPPHLWEDVSPRGLSEIVTLFFRGPPAPSDLNRFAYYASRVQTLGRSDVGRDGTCGEKIDPSVFHYLHQHRPTSAILPRLRRLVWNIVNANALSCINFFLGPNVRYVHLSLFAHHSQSDITATLDHIKEKCAALEEICMVDRTKSAVIAEARSQFMGSLASLRVISLTLGCRTLGYRAMVHLANLRHLEKLTLTIRALSPATVRDAHWNQLYPIPDAPFPQLRTLSVETAAMDFCFALLSLVQDSPVQTLHLDYDPYDSLPPPEYPTGGPTVGERTFQKLQFLDVSTPCLAVCTTLFKSLRLTAVEKLDVRIAVPAEDDLERFIAVVSRCFSSSSLTSLHVVQRSPFVGSSCHTSDIILPLLQFSKLTDMVLLPGGHIELDDDVAGDMARSWPELQCITIGAGDHAKRSRRISLAGLIPFAIHCDKLRYIRLGIDSAGILPPVNHAESTVPSNTSVNELWIGLCPLPHDKAQEVATFLGHLFPGLQLLHAYHSSECGQWSWRYGGGEVCPWAAVRKEILENH